MNESNHISDQDRQLAREFGKILDSSQGQKSINNPLLNSLNSFKSSELSGEHIDLKSRKRESWEYIKQNINHSSKPKETRIFRIGSIKHLGKIAAAITISAILSIYYFQTQSTILQPLAAAVSTVETVTLKDGSTVTLRPHSKLFEYKSESGTHKYKLEGEAYFSVSKNEHRKFVVQAKNGSVEVLGTEFNVRTWDSSTEVYLKTGSLRLSSDNEETSTILSPGEFATLMADHSITTPETTDEELFTSWKRNEIIFVNRRAESIFSELEHHYSINITAPDTVKNETLGGSLPLENIEMSLENLGTVLGGEFVQTASNTYKFVSAE
jgi:ferric-dicitrate binding protein FerR (iron transport regulator)